MANSRNNWGLLILAGVGAGTLAGALIGLTLGRRAVAPGTDELGETVEELKHKANQVLEQLSENVAELLHETRAQVEQAAAAQGATLQEVLVHGPDES